MNFDERMMQRALLLAECGRGEVSPNPMVGAVVVCDGKIIGEGNHRKFGGPHAEVNAINSVEDKSLLRKSTIYVTLEPCAHYGKTPPCADLIVRCGIPRVVIGCKDPFAKVDGRGIDRILASGAEVEVGILEKECLRLNRRFITAHTLHRPFVALKWACSADGFIGRKGQNEPEPVKFSDAVGKALVHKMRSEFDAILVGNGTVISDNPRLDVRSVDGRSPKRVVWDRSRRLSGKETVFSGGETLVAEESDVQSMLKNLYNIGVTSLLVEGGAGVLNSFLDSGEWDTARIETTPVVLAENGFGRVPMPSFPPKRVWNCGESTIIEIDNIIAENQVFEGR